MECASVDGQNSTSPINEEQPQIVWLDYNSNVDFSEYNRCLKTHLVYFNDAVECERYIVSCQVKQWFISLLISGDFVYEKNFIERSKSFQAVEHVYLITDDPPWAPPMGFPKHKKVHIIFNNVPSVMSQLCRDLICNDKCRLKTYSCTEDLETHMTKLDNELKSRSENFSSQKSFENWDPLLPHYTAENKIMLELGKFSLLYTDNKIVDPIEMTALFSSNRPVISQFEHIKSVRDTNISDEERFYYATPVRRYPKLRGIFHGFSPLHFQSGSYDATGSLYTESINVFSLHDRQESTCDLSMEGVSFLWFQTMIDMLNRVPSSPDLARSDSITYIQLHCDTKTRQAELEKWTKEYQSDQALSWYTRDTFLFQIVNNALRRQNLDEIFKLRYFINHLCYQLSQDHKNYVQELKNRLVDSMRVYRGQRISATELEKINDNINGLISLNTFTSTSMDRDVALMFAGDGDKLDDPNSRAVLFEIEVDILTSNQARPFANIAKYSNKHDEAEVLFSIGSIFEIKSVSKLQSGTWLIKVKTIKSRPDARVAELLAHFRDKVHMEQVDMSEFMWGRFFIEVGEYRTAQSFYECLIAHRGTHFFSCENTDDLSSMHNDLAFIYYQQQEYKKAIQHYSIALTHVLARIPTWKLVSTGKHPYKTVRRQVNPGEHTYFPKAPYLQDQELVELATLYNNLAGALDKTGEYKHALTYLEKAVFLEHSCTNRNFDATIDIANNIGLVQMNLAHFDLALKYFKIALEYLPTKAFFDSPRKAAICYNMGNVYEAMSDWKQALDHYELALDLVLKWLPPNHPFVLACLRKVEEIRGKLKAVAAAAAVTEKIAVAEEAAVAEKAAVAATSRVAVAERTPVGSHRVITWRPPVRTANSVCTAYRIRR